MNRFIDLFSGCGGTSLGFVRAGFHLLAGIELDEKAARTHAINFFGDSSVDDQNRHATPHDITKLPPDIFLQNVLQLDSPEGLVQVIVGGPPCQAFARIGRAKLRDIMAHPEAYLQDERANLYSHFLEYVEFFQPLAVVMENVPDIMNFGGKNVADEIAASLDDLGYECRYTLLNSAHYGVPQMRQRFYLLALHKKLGIVPDFPAGTHCHELPKGYFQTQKVALNGSNSPDSPAIPQKYFLEPEPTLNRSSLAVTAQDALRDLPIINVDTIKQGPRKFDTYVSYRQDMSPTAYGQLMRSWPGFESSGGVYDHVTRYLPRDYKLFERMRPGDQYPEAHNLATMMFEEALAELEKREGRQLKPGSEEFHQLQTEYIPPYDPGKFRNRWRKMEANQPVRTLTAHIGKDTYTHIHYDSDQKRVISVREAARLQSFPDGFKFIGAMNAAFRQIGNAVPPLQAHALACHLLELLPETDD